MRNLVLEALRVRRFADIHEEMSKLQRRNEKKVEYCIRVVVYRK